LPDAAARLAAIPDALATARATLRDCPRIHLDTAAGQFRGTASFVRNELPELLAEAPGMASTVEPEAAAAVSALEAFSDWLGTGPALEEGRDARLGRRLWEAKLWHTLDTELTAAEVLRLARENLDRVGEEIRAAIIEAGKDLGLVQVGARAYATNTLESGWIPSPVPAVYTGEKMKAYRQWLPGTSYEANAGLGGSFVSDKIEDYYTSPHELGYAAFTKFDHDFIGKEALQKMEGKAHRKKVTFAWNDQDVVKVLQSMFAPPGENYKFIDLPLSNYASSSFDAVMSGGKVVGASMFSGYSYNERKMLSLGFVEEQYAKPGTQLTLLWGEEGGGSKKTTVERHRQIEIRAIVSPAPYAKQAQTTYHEGWRSKATV